MNKLVPVAPALSVSRLRMHLFDVMNMRRFSRETQRNSSVGGKRPFSPFV